MMNPELESPTQPSQDAPDSGRVPLSVAAKRLSVSRASIYRWAKEGRISVTVDNSGQKVVDMAELARVFPETAARHLNKDSKRQAQDTENTSESGTDSLILEAELHATREALRITQDQLAEAKEREHRLLGIVESQTRLLEHKPEPQPPAPVQAGISPWVGWLGVAGIVAVVLVFTYLR